MEEQYIPLDPDNALILDKVKKHLITLAEDVITGRVAREEASNNLKGITMLLNIESQKAIEEVFSRLITPTALFEQILKEVKERKSKYSLIEAIGCIRATLHDCGHVMTTENQRIFVDSVIKNLREGELDKGDLNLDML